MPKTKSLIYQVREALNQKLRIGESRHHDKQVGITHDGIYSWGTYNTYLAKCCAFVKWVKANYGLESGSESMANPEVKNISNHLTNLESNQTIKTLADAKQYVNAYLQHHINQGYSPYTQKTIASALAKLYGCSTKDFIPTQTRHRANITRSRKGKAKFLEANNKEFVDFCRATGLRRHEIKNLRPENLGYDESTGKYMLVGIKGKGGRLRSCPILFQKEPDIGNSKSLPNNTTNNTAKETTETTASNRANSSTGDVALDTTINTSVGLKVIERIKNTPANERVWSKIPSRADIHSYRADYCKSLYELHARPIADIPASDRYYCRKDLKGVIYDKRAMAVASRALGHNRIGVIAGSYLYGGGVGE